eukprot:11175880-Lingulodinium_polyedra.AAC.1
MARCLGPPAASTRAGERAPATKLCNSSSGGKNLMGSSSVMACRGAATTGCWAACEAHCAIAKGPTGPWSSCALTHWKTWP